jgi:hypothetical protein
MTADEAHELTKTPEAEEYAAKKAAELELKVNNKLKYVYRKI